MKFEKQGAKVSRKISPRVGILHDASDWVLLAVIIDSKPTLLSLS